MCHAIERARERYGVSLTFDDLEALRVSVVENRALLMGRNATSEQWLVEHKGVQMVAVCSRVDYRIITFLFRNSRQQYKRFRHKPPKVKQRLVRAARRREAWA